MESVLLFTLWSRETHTHGLQPFLSVLIVVEVCVPELCVADWDVVVELVVEVPEEAVVVVVVVVVDVVVSDVNCTLSCVGINEPAVVVTVCSGTTDVVC